MKKEISQKEFQDTVLGGDEDTQYIFHSIVSLLRRMNRDGKLEDYEFQMLHQTIDLIYKR